LRSAGRDPYQALHLATNVRPPGETSCLPQPAIVFSPPAGTREAAASLLPPSEVLQLKLDADIVVLSACNTG
jgi:CHAT domain-containing protein